jgi:hypothetical protein
MKKFLIIIISILSLTNTAYGFMTYGEYKELMKSDRTGALYYIRGITMGNLSYSRYMVVDKPDNKQVYCPPNDIKLTIKHAIDVIEQEANRIIKDTDEDVNKVSVPLMYIWGMQDKYPCSN